MRSDQIMQSNTLKTRRQFVLQSAAAAVGVGLSPCPQMFAKNNQLNSPPAGTATSETQGAVRAVDFSNVKITDEFWTPKIAKIGTTTLPACIAYTQLKTGRIRNFEKVARKQNEKHEGIYYDDSDVYKAIEAIAYSLSNHPDPMLEKTVEAWISTIAAAQLPDGYLNTYYSLTGLDGRWTDMEKHEDYCAGHLIEAAIAYYRTTGNRTLLDVAIRFADHINKTFREQNRHWVSGHEEIELALMKLYEVTQNDRYLKLAEWYLEQRGHGYGRGGLWSNGRSADYCQDSVPVKDQRQIRGHAVRAMYLYCGAADVAAMTKDADYLKAMTAVWEDVVYRNMYLTGGIGSSGQNEGFTKDYDLPNADAYCETCASVGMVFWNHRMNLLTGESKYIDVLERSLYNGALDGLSLSGDQFFYGNPLASSASFSSSSISGHRGRSEWFGTACCPSNIARLVASVGSYVYVASNNSIWVNLFIGSSTTIRLGKTDLSLDLTTEYPWDGKVKLLVNPTQSIRCSMRIRIPGWVKGVAVPGELYRFSAPQVTEPIVLINGRSMPHKEESGYAVIERSWKRGDVVELSFPMDVRRVVAREEVAADRGRFAFQRGPMVYCVEGADNSGSAWNLVFPDNSGFAAIPYQVLEESVVAIKAEGLALTPADGGLAAEKKRRSITAIPYYTWANRENYEMQVWLPTRIQDLKINA